jgi:hypothetical protein
MSMVATFIGVVCEICMAGVACVVEMAMCFNYLRSHESTYYRAPLLGELMVVHMTFLVALQQLGVLPLFG